MNRRFILPQLREAIRSTEADIVFLQEVVGENSKKQMKHESWPLQSHCEYLADSIWHGYAYGKNAEYAEGHHGNALLSKFAITHAEQIDISTNRLEQRGILYATVDIHGIHKPVHCICAHLGLFSRSRRKQFAMIENFIYTRCPPGEPCIIAGDFNDWRGKEVLRFQQSTGFKNALVEHQGHMPRTFPAWYPLLRLDCIFYQGFSVRTTSVYYHGAWSKLSDHAALSAQLYTTPSE